jgi:hypothetical protein
MTMQGTTDYALVMGWDISSDRDGLQPLPLPPDIRANYPITHPLLPALTSTTTVV